MRPITPITLSDEIGERLALEVLKVANNSQAHAKVGKFLEHLSQLTVAQLEKIGREMVLVKNDFFITLVVKIYHTLTNLLRAVKK